MRIPEAARLLQAIIADPDNDTPRLAYADWLEAEGDADRAAFIRIQCALERLPTEDPQHSVLRQRETELLGQYGYRWAEEFGQQISVWVYRRGFIEQVEMCLEASAEQIRAVLGRAPIRHIRDLSQLDDLTGVVEALPDLARLTGLEFWNLYAFDDRLLARMLGATELTNLHTLILHHDRNGNLAKEAVLVEALMSPLRTNLRELAVNVDGTWRGPSPRLVQAMARSPSLTNLRKLDLSNARLGVATVDAVRRSTALAGLKELDLGSCSLTEATWRAVLNLPQLPSLLWLRLHDARLVDQQGRHRGYLRDQPEYVDAFTARVAAVDWDTKFIDPYSGGTVALARRIPTTTSSVGHTALLDDRPSASRPDQMGGGVERRACRRSLNASTPHFSACAPCRCRYSLHRGACGSAYRRGCDCQSDGGCCRGLECVRSRS